MNRLRTIVVSNALMFLVSCTAYGADAGGVALLPADSTSAFRLSPNAGNYAAMSSATVTGQRFQNVLRIRVTTKPPRPGDVILSAPVDAAIATGDVLLVSFWMRSGAAGEATLDAGFRTVPGSAPASGAPALPGARGGAGAGRPRRAPLPLPDGGRVEDAALSAANRP